MMGKQISLFDIYPEKGTLSSMPIGALTEEALRGDRGGKVERLQSDIDWKIKGAQILGIAIRPRLSLVIRQS